MKLLILIQHLLHHLFWKGIKVPLCSKNISKRAQSEKEQAELTWPN